MASVRQWDSGATRDDADDKLDFEGFLSPLVIERFGRYMHKNRDTAEGRRDSDNWQQGIPLTAYIKSLWRHFLDLWLLHRGFKHASREPDPEEALCAILFNASGYLHELLKRKLEAEPEAPTWGDGEALSEPVADEPPRSEAHERAVKSAAQWPCPAELRHLYRDEDDPLYQWPHPPRGELPW